MLIARVLGTGIYLSRALGTKQLNINLAREVAVAGSPKLGQTVFKLRLFRAPSRGEIPTRLDGNYLMRFRDQPHSHQSPLPPSPPDSLSDFHVINYCMREVITDNNDVRRRGDSFSH